MNVFLSAYSEYLFAFYFWHTNLFQLHIHKEQIKFFWSKYNIFYVNSKLQTFAEKFTRNSPLVVEHIHTSYIPLNSCTLLVPDTFYLLSLF